LGPSGSGKTTFGLNFLARSTPEAPGLLFGFYESPQRLRLKAEALGLDFGTLQDSGALHVVWKSVTTELIDKLALDLLRLVKEQGIKRVFLDSLGGMARAAADQARILDLFNALMSELRARGVTVMASWEVRGLLSGKVDAPAPDLSSIVDNLMLTRFAQTPAGLSRQLSILKIRDNPYDPALLDVLIGEQGLTVKKAAFHALNDSGNAAA
jgi:circadian clock protein KaiC